MKDSPVNKAIKILEVNGFTNDQAKNILKSVCADTPKKLAESANKLINLCTETARNWELVCLIANGLVSVSYNEKGMMLHLTGKGIEEGKKLEKATRGKTV